MNGVLNASAVVAFIVRRASYRCNTRHNMAGMRALKVLTLLYASAVILSQQADAVKSLSAAQQNELELQQAQVSD